MRGNLNDNQAKIDNADSADIDMMPIRNVFNEWHAANTSKKVRAVIAANAKAGKMMTPYCPYGYVKSDDEMRTPIIDPYAAGIVRRIPTTTHICGAAEISKIT